MIDSRTGVEKIQDGCGTSCGNAQKVEGVSKNTRATWKGAPNGQSRNDWMLTHRIK